MVIRDARELRKLLSYKPDTVPLKLQLLADIPHEQKLWLTVLLDALANMKDAEREEWIGSQYFVRVCKYARVEPAVAAAIPKSVAKKAWRIIRSVSSSQSPLLDQLMRDLKEQHDQATAARSETK